MRLCSSSQHPLNAEEIDALYGLEPVFEPGNALGSELSVFAAINCPYCAEGYATAVDLTAGSFSYVEDCQICCQLMELSVVVNTDGACARVDVRRLD
jgi:hypothetical protein